MTAPLQSRTWFGFDLDDTLHDFTSASREAVSELCNVVKEFSDTGDINEVKRHYKDILQKGNVAFTDGRTSNDYRRERISALLQVLSIPASSSLLEKLLVLYDTTLQLHLQPKPGALQTLKALKENGKRVLVVSEGPHDAQEGTIKQLGMAPYVDEIVTSNREGVSKEEGLFRQVLQKFSIEPDDMVFVGDSEARDIVPTRDLGILAIKYDEGVESNLQEGREPWTTNSLEMIAQLVERV